MDRHTLKHLQHSFYQKVKFLNTEEFLTDQLQAIGGLLISVEEMKKRSNSFYRKIS